MQEKVDDHYHLLVQGFSETSIPEPEKTLDELRSSFPHVHLQLVRADLIAGREHLFFAARNAIAGYKSPYRKSKSLAVELLLYVSCQRQISKAITFLGVRPKDQNIILVALGNSDIWLKDLTARCGFLIQGRLNDELVEIYSQNKANTLKECYGITSTEMEAARVQGEVDEDVLKRLVIERSALLTLEG